MARLTIPSIIAGVIAGCIAAGSATAMPASCQAGFEKVTKDREAAVARVNAFNKRRPTPTQACGAFNTLSSAEARMLEWLEANKDWCQIPDEFHSQFKQATEQTNKVRGQACTAAKKEQAMRRQVQRNAQPRGPQVGGGVRLPQGAL